MMMVTMTTASLTQATKARVVRTTTTGASLVLGKGKARVELMTAMTASAA
jgi:phenylpyruvate tautomerase PptA (4-oxalocrotonate tautomerase family)